MAALERGEAAGVALAERLDEQVQVVPVDGQPVLRPYLVLAHLLGDQRRDVTLAQVREALDAFAVIGEEPDRAGRGSSGVSPTG